MSTIIKAKRSAVQGKVPLTGDLQLGEFAINTYDGKLFTKKNAGGVESIVEIGGSSGIFTTGSQSLTTTDSDQVVDSYLLTDFRTVKYLVELSNSTNYHATELFVTHNDSNAYTTEYGTIYTNTSLGNIDCGIDSGSLKLLVTPTNANTTVKFARFEVAAVSGTVGSGGGGLDSAVVINLIDSNYVAARAPAGGSSSFSNQYVLTGTTTNNTETEILVGGSTRIPVATNKAVNYIANIAARRTDTAGDYAMFELRGIASNQSGTVADVGSLYELVVARTNAGYLVDARANDSNNSINIFVTGVTGHTIDWKASVQTIEI